MSAASSATAAVPSQSFLEQSLQPLAYGVTITVFILSTISVGVRFWSRAFLVRNLGFDDWMMLLVGLASVGQHAILFLFLSYGSGRHLEWVLMNTPESLLKVLKLLFIEEIYYMFNLWVVKQSILLFYLRLSPARMFRIGVFAVTGLNGAVTVICWFIYCLQCRPLNAVWDTTITDKSCLPSLFLFFFPASLNILVDLIIVILPMKTLWEIKASLGKRLRTMAILGVGSIAIVVSCLRLIILYRFSVETDITWLLGWMVAASSAEIDVGIIAANIPSMKSAYSHYFGARGVQSGAGSAGALHGSPGHVYELSDERDSRGRRSNRSKASRAKTLGESVLNTTIADAHHSQEELYDRAKANMEVVTVSRTESPGGDQSSHEDGSV